MSGWRVWIFWAALAGLMSCSRADYVQQPPARYRGDTTAEVTFVDTRDVWESCAEGPAVAACTRGRVITMPNPCQWPGGESYAQLLCHEMAHVNGWPIGHPTD